MLPLQVQADEESFQEVRNEFKASPVWKKYISQIDRLLPRLSDEQLQETLYKVEDLYYWGEDVTEDQVMIFEYMLAAITNIQDQRNVVIHTSTLPNEEKKRVETELIQGQNMLGNELSKVVAQSMLEWNTLTSYEDTGDFSLDFDMDLEALWNVQSSLKLNDYSAKTSSFDQQLTAQVEAFVDASIAWEDISFQVQSLIDFITKNGNIYLLAEKLEVSLKNNNLDEEFGDIIEKLKTLAETKTYLSFEEEGSTEFLSMLENIKSENIVQKIQETTKTSWFIATAKQDTSYILLPSKEFCSMMKEFMSIFDPFSGPECTNTQYKNMLEDLQEAGITLLYTPWVQKSLRFNINNPSGLGNINVVWKESQLLSFTGQIVNPENPKKDKISFSYFPKQSFEILFTAEDENISVHMSGTLSSIGNLAALKIKATADKMLANLNYAQEKLNFDIHTRTPFNDIISCKGLGDVKAQSFDINASCDITSTVIAQELTDSQGKLRLEMKTSGDMREGKNNYTLNVTGKTPLSEIFSFQMQNVGKRTTNPNIKIIAPSKTVDIQEVMGEIYESGY
jgi:hypothetical protein